MEKPGGWAEWSMTTSEDAAGRGLELTAVGEMSARIDSLETAISDLMQDGEPPSPSPAQKRH